MFAVNVRRPVWDPDLIIAHERHVLSDDAITMSDRSKFREILCSYLYVTP